MLFSIKIAMVKINKNGILTIFIAPIILIYYEALFSLVNRTNTLSLKNVALIIFYGLFISFIFYLLSKINKKVGLVFLIVIITCFALLFMTESYINKFFNSFMDFDMIFGRASDVCKNYLGDAIGIVVKHFYIIIFNMLPIVILIVFRKDINADYGLVGVISVIGSIIVFLALGIILSVINMGSRDVNEDLYVMIYNNGLINGFKENILSPKQSSEELSFSEVEVVEEKKLDETVEEKYEYNIMNIDFDKLPTDNSDIINLNNYVKSQMPTKKNKYTGLFKGKNLVLICAESFSKHAVKKELIPTLYRLVHDGFYFPKSYATTTTMSTSEGEFELLLGMSSVNGTTDMLDSVDKNNYFTIASAMKREGYHTSCYHNGNYYYYNRNITHDNLGYEFFMAKGSGLENYVRDMSDYTMFDATLNVYKDKKPFSVYYMTYDGHLPYKNDSPFYKKYSEEVYAICGKDISTELCTYYCKMVGIDRALENYIKRLDEEGILDDTVIALTPDHFPYGLLQSNGGKPFYELYKETFDTNDVDKRDANSFVIWSHSLENDLKSYATTIDAPVGNVDMLPTLLNLFGLEYDSRLFIGRDVFSDSEPLVFWGNNSFVNDNCYYNGIKKEGKMLDNTALDEKYLDDIKKKVKDKLVFATNVLKYDYFNYLFKDRIVEEKIEEKMKEAEETKVLTDSQKAKIKEKEEAINFGYSGKTYNNLEELNHNFSSINTVEKNKKDGSYTYDILKFGKFEQDGDIMNGPEDLEWMILYQNNDKILLLSRYILDAVPFCAGDIVDWEHSDLRNYATLNFFPNAFGEYEKKRLISVASSNVNDNPVIDYVNVLNMIEIETFFGKEKGRDKVLATKGTPYAIGNGLFVKKDDENWYDGYSSYWLRDVIVNSRYKYYPDVEYNGHVNRVGYVSNTLNIGFRPAIWIKYN